MTECSQLHLGEQDRLKQKAMRLAEVFQRSSSNVEGRNGYLSLRSHELRGLDHPRKRACLTAVHNFLLTRSDGTTAAERFFGPKLRSMFAAVLASVEIPPLPSVLRDEPWARLKGCRVADAMIEARDQANKTYTSQVAESHVDALINARHKRTQKMQWTRQGAHHVLQIRAMIASDEWESKCQGAVLAALGVVA